MLINRQRTFRGFNKHKELLFYLAGTYLLKSGLSFYEKPFPSILYDEKFTVGSVTKALWVWKRGP